MIQQRLTVIALVLFLCACADSDTDNTEAAAPAIDASRLSEIVRVLASDEFEGRAPGTPGGRRTVAWLVDRFTGLGRVISVRCRPDAASMASQPLKK